MTTCFQTGLSLDWKNNNGLLSRSVGPAKVYYTGHVTFYVNGISARPTILGPSFIMADGSVMYTNPDGRFHRAGAPAVMWSNGEKEYWLHGVEYSAEEYFAVVGKI